MKEQPWHVRIAVNQLLDDFSVREALAEQAHDSWSGWMIYLFQESIQNPDGTVTIPLKMVTRWTRQMQTPYGELSEKEKDSDRKEADEYIRVLRNGRK